MAPASWGPRGQPHPLRSEHLLWQRRGGRTEGESAPTASLRGCVVDSPASSLQIPPRWSPRPRPLASPLQTPPLTPVTSLTETPPRPLTCLLSQCLPSPPGPNSTYPSDPNTRPLQGPDPLGSGPSALCSLEPGPDWPRALLEDASCFHCPFPSWPRLGPVLPFSDWLSATPQPFL